jgi:hypothetical protein
VSFGRLTLVGYILMGVGLLGLIVSVRPQCAAQPAPVSESRQIMTPAPARPSRAMKPGTAAL